MLNLQTTFIAIALSLVIGFGSGWKVHGWKTDSETKAITEAAGIIQRSVADTLEEKLKTLKANERIVEREKVKIVNRDVYRNVCIDLDGMRLVNASAGLTVEPSR